MSKHDNLSRVFDRGLVAIIRAKSGERLVEVAEAIYAGGIDVMEVTFTVPNAARVLERVADKLGDKVLLGAGTILDTENAHTAISAGAEFIVSPSTDLSVIEMCHRYDKAIMPGALTPTEVVTAWQAGADIVKVFPCDAAGGPPYLKALHGPLPQVHLMPTGGVTLETSADFLRAGACALGVGSALVNAKTVEAGDMKAIEELTAKYVEIVRRTRAEMAAE